MKTGNQVCYLVAVVQCCVLFISASLVVSVYFISIILPHSACEHVSPAVPEVSVDGSENEHSVNIGRINVQKLKETACLGI